VYEDKGSRLAPTAIKTQDFTNSGTGLKTTCYDLGYLYTSHALKGAPPPPRQNCKIPKETSPWKRHSVSPCSP